MSILRKSFENNFTQIPNHIINNNLVSASAKFLYIYMASKPDDWEFSLNGIVSQLKESKTTVLRMMDELINIGYMDKIKKRVNGRQAVSDYILHLEPSLRSESRNESQKMRVSITESVIETTSNTNKATNKKQYLKSNSLDESKQRDFKSFRKQFISKNIGNLFTLDSLSPWLPETEFTLNDDGYIYNTVSNKIITKEDSYVIWKYLFNVSKTA